MFRFSEYTPFGTIFFSISKAENSMSASINEHLNFPVNENDLLNLYV